MNRLVLDPISGALRTGIDDTTGNPVCQRCSSRIFEDQLYCPGCVEMISREYEARHPWMPSIIVEDFDD